MLAADLFKTGTKLLIADDDPVTRKMLTAFLTSSNYDVSSVVDGPSAIEALTKENAPHIAILDWMMPGLSGPEVCNRLRSAGLKIRPYVIILTTKTDKADLAAGLDAGADDYLSKPFNPVELLARLRVAQRTIHYQYELVRHIADLEEMAQRYQMLGEIIGQPSAAESAPPPSAAPEADRAAAGKPGKKFTPFDEIDAIIVRACAELKQEVLATHIEPPDQAYRAQTFTAWAGLILQKAQLWVDLLLEFDRVEATALFEHSLRRPPANDREILGFLAGMHTIFAAAFRTALKTTHGDILNPLLSTALRTDRVEKPAPPVSVDRETRLILLAGFKLRLTIVRQASPVRQKPPNRLHIGDILTEPFPPPDVSSIPLLNQGVVLNERFIEKLVTWSDKEIKSQPVPVIEPSILARYFHADDLAASAEA